MSELQVSTAQDVIADAAVLALQQHPADGFQPEEYMFGLRELNRLIDKHSIIRTFCFNTGASTYRIPSSKNNYSIGPAGSFTPDFPGPRPTRVLRANFIDNTVTPNVYIPIRILETYEEYADIRVRAIQTIISTKLWYDNGYTTSGATAGVPNPGYGMLWFWGQPTAGYGLELWTPTLLTRFALLGSVFAFPPAYEEFIVTSLAEMLCISYGRPISPDLKTRARKARAAVVGINSKSGYANTDMPSSRGGDDYFNWISGNFG